MEYIFNLETTKIELHFEKSDYTNLGEQEKKKLKSSFLWSNKNKCWISRAKEPNLYYAKEVAKELGFTEEKRQGERLTFSEQLEVKADKAEKRAERYEIYADNAEKRAEQMQSGINYFRGDISFFTQPNINSAGGRAFTSYREKLFARYEKGFEEYKKSDYFKKKADVARTTASNSKFENKAYLERKIKECKKTIKDREKNVIKYEETLYKIESGEECKNFRGELIQSENLKKAINRELELISVEMDKQGFFENKLDSLGGIQFSKENIKVGYLIDVENFGVAEVTSVGSINLIIKTQHGRSFRISFAEVKEVVKEEEKKAEKHPFVIGDTFEVLQYVGLSEPYKKVTYEVIKTTDTTIQVKEKDSENKPINRKPKKTYSGDWRVSINDSHGGTIYKRKNGSIDNSSY